MMMDMDTKERFAKGFRGKKGMEEDAAAAAAPALAVIVAPGEEPKAEKGDTETPGAETAAGTADVVEPTPGTEEEPPTTPPAEGAMPDMAQMPSEEEVPEEDRQAFKSWRGRMQKLWDELQAARKSGAGAVPEATAEAETETETEQQASPAEIRDYLADAPEDIKAIATRYGEDFGPDYISDFSKLFGYIAERHADERMGEVKGEAESLRTMLGDVISGLNSMHMEDIQDAHADVADIVASPEFDQWIKAQDESRQDRIARTLQNGSSASVVRVLNEFKDSLKQEPAAGAIDTSALEAAAGVRSTGVSTPNTSGAAKNDNDAFARGFYRGRK